MVTVVRPADARRFLLCQQKEHRRERDRCDMARTKPYLKSGISLLGRNETQVLDAILSQIVAGKSCLQCELQLGRATVPELSLIVDENQRHMASPKRRRR